MRSMPAPSRPPLWLVALHLFAVGGVAGRRTKGTKGKPGASGRAPMAPAPGGRVDGVRINGLFGAAMGLKEAGDEAGARGRFEVGLL
jgi:hypothetical protein